MSDFTVENAVPTHVSTLMDIGSGQVMRNQLATSAPASASWGVANQAVYIPFIFPWPYMARRAFWINGSSAAGNTDIGLYSRGGARLWSAGSTAQSGASSVQYVTISGGLLITPGRYFLAVANDGTLNRVIGTATAATARLLGMLQQASALPLPNPATFAAYTNNGAIPVAGFTNTASGF